VARLNEFVARLQYLEPGRRSPDLDQALYQARADWQDAMDNDLNVPRALGSLFALVRHVNRLMNNGELDGDQVQQVLEFARQVNGTLDVVDFEDERDDARVEQLVEERNKARHEKDFERADVLRDELQSMGVTLVDTPSGTRWKRCDSHGVRELAV
jgi:cysteinyl-tRNA synthetase